MTGVVVACLSVSALAIAAAVTIAILDARARRGR